MHTRGGLYAEVALDYVEQATDALAKLKMDEESNQAALNALIAAESPSHLFKVWLSPARH